MKERKHGTRTKYVHDRCRCPDCCAANSRYSVLNEQARRAGVTPYVDSTEARSHLDRLRASGLGMRRISDLSGVSRSALQDVTAGRPCAAPTAARILRVDPYALLAPNALIDATETWQRVAELQVLGHTKAWISQQIGQGGRALQIGKRICTQRNASAIYNLWVQERDHIGVWE